jgi:hypothetical protein
MAGKVISADTASKLQDILMHLTTAKGAHETAAQALKTLIELGIGDPENARAKLKGVSITDALVFAQAELKDAGLGGLQDALLGLDLLMKSLGVGSGAISQVPPAAAPPVGPKALADYKSGRGNMDYALAALRAAQNADFDTAADVLKSSGPVKNGSLKGNVVDEALGYLHTASEAYANAVAALQRLVDLGLMGLDDVPKATPGQKETQAQHVGRQRAGEFRTRELADWDPLDAFRSTPLAAP